MLFLSRLLRTSAHPALKWGVAGLLGALGVGLIIWGLLTHSPTLALRGVLELVIVGVIVLRVFGTRGTRGGAGPLNPP